MKKGRCCDYNKGQLSVVICERYSKRFTKSWWLP